MGPPNEGSHRSDFLSSIDIQVRLAKGPDISTPKLTSYQGRQTDPLQTSRTIAASNAESSAL